MNSENLSTLNQEQSAVPTEFTSRNLTPLLSAGEIAARVREIGGQISEDYRGRQPKLICVLKGAAIFLSDLIRAIDLSVTVDFIAVSSYGKEVNSSGEVRIVKDLDSPLEGSDIIIVEDILDTGLTLQYLLNTFHQRGVASVRIATLLNKPARRRIEVSADYIGFEIPDEFVVGYGLDYAERYRNLPFIGVLRPDLPA